MVPKNFTGSILYSLNQLKTRLPEIYAIQVQKYTGREILMQCKIPLLNCLWNDVLHFSPVHPNKIREAFVSAEFEWTVRPWFAISPVNYDFSPENAVIFLNTPPEDPTQLSSFDFPETDFIPFSFVYGSSNFLLSLRTQLFFTVK
jgi:hypothetical protein